MTFIQFIKCLFGYHSYNWIVTITSSKISNCFSCKYCKKTKERQVPINQLNKKLMLFKDSESYYKKFDEYLNNKKKK